MSSVIQHWIRTKPPFGSDIDWGHPLARNLNRCWLFNTPLAYSAQNYSGSIPDLIFHDDLTGLTAAGAGITGSPFGSAYFIPDDGAAMLWGQQFATADPKGSILSRFNIGSTSVSIFTIATAVKTTGTFSGSDDNSGCVYTSTRNNTSDKSPTFCATTVSGGAGTHFGLCYAFDTSGTGLGCKGATALLTDGTFYSFLGTYEFTSSVATFAGTWNCYVNGMLDNTTVNNFSLAGSVSAFAGGSQQWQIGRATNWPGGSGLTIVCVYVWTRALTSTEARLLHHDPYCFLKVPLHRRYFFYGVSAAAAGATDTDSYVFGGW